METAFNALSSSEKLYSHYLSQASWSVSLVFSLHDCTSPLGLNFSHRHRVFPLLVICQGYMLFKIQWWGSERFSPGSGSPQKESGSGSLPLAEYACYGGGGVTAGEQKWKMWHRENKRKEKKAKMKIVWNCIVIVWKLNEVKRLKNAFRVINWTKFPATYNACCGDYSLYSKSIAKYKIFYV